MASYPGIGSNGGGAAAPSPSAYTPFVPSGLRQNHPQLADDDPVGDCLAALRRHRQRLARFWSARGRRTALAALLRAAHLVRRNMAASRVLSFPHVLVALWVLVLMWGERWIFHTKVESCHWSNWEKWVRGSCLATSAALLLLLLRARYRDTGLTVTCA